jgi:methyl-galactoside transport system permease protein
MFAEKQEELDKQKLSAKTDPYAKQFVSPNADKTRPGEDSSPIYTDPKIKEFEKSLYELRKEGSIKINELEDEIYDTKHNRMIDEKTRTAILHKDYEQLEAAKKNSKANKEKINDLVKAGVEYTKALGAKDYQKKKEEGKGKVAGAKIIWQKNSAELKSKHQDEMNKIKAQFASKHAEVEKANLAALDAAKSPEDKKAVATENKTRMANLNDDQKGELSSEYIAFTTSMKDEKLKYRNVIQEAKDSKHNAYLAQYNEIAALKGGKAGFFEDIVHKYEDKLYNFNLTTYFLNNALYLVVIIFFIACAIITPIKEGYSLLTISNIVSFIDNASSRIFFALGVGGLILLGGTDLSIGRIIGMGTFVVGFIMHESEDGAQSTSFFNLKSVVGGDLASRLILSFLLCIFVCVLFSGIAGFFSAKFKMHPFITTLSTMMIIYGFMMVATAGIPTGPVSTDLAEAVVGHIGRTSTNPGFPKYLIYAVIGIAACWFIWNKTKFGKDIYAVGGNPEAAAVSGISYFKVTLGVFIMAGIFYGIGCFLYGFNSNPAANNGYGYELDAIAACVVGGISFFGGIGKVKGAVIGVLIFSGLSTVLTIMNVSSYWQFVIKGLILMTAVALDSVKYLKKK